MRVKQKSYGWHKLLALMLAVVLVLTNLPAMGNVYAATDLWDLRNFVTGVTVRDSSGQEVTDGKFNYGETYTFSISFKEGAGTGQFAYNDDGFLVYQLDERLVIQTAVVDGDIYVANQNSVGKYSIDTNGKVLVRFGNYTNTGEPTDPEENFIDYYTDAQFTLEIEARFTKSGSSDPLDFGTGAIITIEELNYPKPKLDVTKQAGSFDAKTQTLVYTIKIKAPDANASAEPTKLKNIIVTDVLSAGNYTLGDLRDVYENISYTVSGDSTSYPIAVTDWISGYRFPTSLELDPGDEITVTYTLNVKNLVAGVITSETKRLQYGFTLKNTVTARADDADEVKKTADKWVAKTFISKSRVKTDDIITWTAWVGDGTEKLNGKTITDTLTGGSLPDNASAISVTLYGKPDKVGTFESKDIITTTPAQLVTIDNNTFTYVVPSTFGDVYRVSFKYNTNAAQGSSDVKYENTIFYYDLSAKADYTVARAPGPASSLTKESSGIKKVDGKYVIDYTVEIKVPAGNQGRKINFRDTLTMSLNDTSIDAKVPAIRDVSISPYDANFELITAQGSADRNYWYIYFGTKGMTANNYSWPFTNDRTVKFTYTIPLADTPAVKGDASSIQDLLAGNPGSYLQNTAAVREGSAKIDEVITKDSWPIHKSVTVNAEEDGVFDYVVTLNSGSPISLFAADKGVFTDTFAPGLEYVPGSLYVEADSAFYGPCTGTVGGDASENSSLIDLKSNDDKTTTLTIELSELALLTGTPGAWKMGTASADWYTNGVQIQIRYQLRIKGFEEIKSSESVNYKNTATIDNTTCGTDFSNSAEIDYAKENPLKKTMTPEKGTSRIAVDITINPDGLKLAPQDQDRFEAVDTMSAHLSFYLSTIKISTQSKVNGVWDGQWKEQAISAEPNTLWSMKAGTTDDGKPTVTFILPDETPVRIQYMALVTAPVGETVTLSNKITVFGYSDTKTEDSYVVTKTGANASADKITLHLFKNDSLNNDTRLNGAEFKLYMAIGNEGPYDGKETEKITVGGIDFYYVMSDDGGTNGEYLFDSPWITPTHEAVFLLVETKAPTGYTLPTAPGNYTFFVIHTMSADDQAELESTLDAEISKTADSMNISNTKTPVPPLPTEDPTTEPTTSEPTPEDTTPGKTTDPSDGPTDPSGSEPTDPTEGTEPTEGSEPTEAPTPPATRPEPPSPPPGQTLVPTEDGGYEVIGEDGTPLGKWQYDPETEEWVFEEYDVPLGQLPSTGAALTMTPFLLAGGTVGLITLKVFKGRRKDSDPEETEE